WMRLCICLWKAGIRDGERVVIALFFQAEDGIRDRTVTGVQTCALPISWVPHDGGGHRAAGADRGRGGHRALELSDAARGVEDRRSEERRVGKECKCRG